MFGAAPHSAEPPSNKMSDPMINHLIWNVSFAFDNSRILATEARGKPTPTQGSFSNSPRSVYIDACTVAVIVVSRPKRRAL